MSEPFPEHRADPREEHDKLRRQLVLDYKHTFGGERGERVLKDLQHRFGFGMWPAMDTEDERKIARRVFMQGPLYHIDRMLKTTFRQRKPRPNKPRADTQT